MRKQGLTGSRRRGLAPHLQDRLLRMLQQGIDLQRAGDFLGAERRYQMVLREAPEHPDALHLMGTIAVEARRLDVSVDYLEHAARLKPADPVIRNNLANSLILSLQPERAVQHLRRALKANPRFLEARCNLARALRGMGKAADAVGAYDTVLRQKPDFTMARVGRAEALVDLGDMERAVQSLRGILADHPRHAGAWAALATAHTFTAADPEIAGIERVLEDDALRPRARERLHHVGGKINNDLGRYDAAFHHFHAAKEIAGTGFDLDAYRSFVDLAISRLDAAYFAARRGFGDPSERPVFIVGMPRSGTTLTEQIAASHPLVHGAGELTDLQRIARTITRAPRHTTQHFDDIAALDAQRSAKAAAAYLSALRRHAPGAARVTDKMPHNFQLLGLVALLLPNARIVHCRRDPIDNCVSCFMQHFLETHGYNANLAKLGLYYREYHRLMEHWRRVLPIEIFDIGYETLIGDQEGSSRALIAHLGLEWDDACLAFHQTERAVQTPSRWQVRQPIHKNSIKRWKRYEGHLGPLVSALGDLADTG